MSRLVSLFDVIAHQNRKPATSGPSGRWPVAVAIDPDHDLPHSFLTLQRLCLRVALSRYDMQCMQIYDLGRKRTGRKRLSVLA